MYEISTPVCPQLFYRKSGTGPVVVLLHGFPESSLVWSGIIDTLSRSFTVIAPDLPGSGKSIIDKATSIDEMATCIKHILEAEKIEKAVLGGHSMGGYVSFSFARMYPEMVAGLSVIHSTPVADDEEKKKMRRKAIELIGQGGKKMFVSQMVPNLFCKDYKQKHPETVEQCITGSLEMSEAGMINFYNAMINRKDHAYLPAQLSFPIQWIMGKDDSIMPYKKSLQCCNNAFVNFASLYQNCGHMGMFEAPVEMSKDLSNFIYYCQSSLQK